MGAVTRESTLYAKLITNKYLGQAYEMGGRAYPLPFEAVIDPATVAGDILKLVQIPAHATVVGLDLARPAMTSTAVIIGEAVTPDTDRFHASSNWSAAGNINGLPVAGQNYRPSVPTDVIVTFVTGDPTDSAEFKGVFWIIPGA